MMLPVSSQVAIAATTTTPRVIPVFCTTESIVIRPVSTVPYWPPRPYWVWVAGASPKPAYCAPPRPLNCSDRAKTGFLLCIGLSSKP